MNDSSVFIVFGGYGGIGSALSKRLVDDGHTVIVAGPNADKLNAIANDTGASTIQADATIPDEVQACFDRAIEDHGKVDGVAHCVGSILLKPAHLTSDDEWMKTINLNLNSAFYVLRSAVKAMTKTGGSIALVSTAAARIGIPNHEAIAAAKGGVIGLTQSAASTYSMRNIRVNCVAPGLVDTPMAERITSNETALKASTSMHALGRIGAPNDIASALQWLLDPSNSWVTGQVIGVDGGLGTLRAR